ncbi:hypothetical protein ACS0TY_024309 [Phlomoides rotata]
MEAHLASLHDRMWEVITSGPIQFGHLRGSETATKQSVNSTTQGDAGEGVQATNNSPNVIVDAEQSKLMNLDKVARSVLLQVVPDSVKELRDC